MSKKDSIVSEETKVEKKVDYKTRWKEAKENLLIQLKESLEQIEFHKTRATKIQGVIEVNDQLFLEAKENENE